MRDRWKVRSGKDKKRFLQGVEEDFWEDVWDGFWGSLLNIVDKKWEKKDLKERYWICDFKSLCFVSILYLYRVHCKFEICVFH